RSVGGQAVDLVDAQQRRVLLVARLWPREALDVVTLAQRESSHLRRGHVHVLRSGQVSGRPQEPVSLVAQVEQSFGRNRLTLELARLAVLLTVAATPAAPAPVAFAVRLSLVLGLDTRLRRGAAVTVTGRSLGCRPR